MCLRIRSKVKAKKNVKASELKVKVKGKSDHMRESVQGEKVEKKGKASDLTWNNN